MTKPLKVTERQVTAICRGAAKAGFVAEVKLGDIIVRLMPENANDDKKPLDEVKEGYL